MLITGFRAISTIQVSSRTNASLDLVQILKRWVLGAEYNSQSIVPDIFAFAIFAVVFLGLLWSLHLLHDYEMKLAKLAGTVGAPALESERIAEALSDKSSPPLVTDNRVTARISHSQPPSIAVDQPKQ